MALNWIVPARRLVISERKTYQQVLDDWIAQLRDSRVRDKLIEWYRPLVSGRDLRGGYDGAVALVELWKQAFVVGRRWHPSAVAPGSGQSLDELGFWVRLWKGPLRVLVEEQTYPPPDPPPTRPPPRAQPELTSIDVGGTIQLSFDTVTGEVLNPDAVFLPGDVLELPLFRFWWLAGITNFGGARFRIEGSPFFGTSVCDRAGEVPGAVHLHDNLLAMRFQALLSLAVGGFASLDPVWTTGGRNEERALHPTVEGRTVHPRGIIYGGSLGDVCRGSEYLFNTQQWGTLHVPTLETLGQFAEGTRLTTGWACSPCALALASFICHETGAWTTRGNSSVSSNMRAENGAAYLKANGVYDFFDPALPGGRGAQTAILARLWAERGLAGSPSMEGLRSLAFGRLFGNADSVADNPSRFHHEVILPPATDVPIAAAQVLDYLDGAAWGTIGLNGHEYSWVPVHPHACLLDEPVLESAEGRVPPRVGLIAAYDPVTGVPYVAQGQPPDLYLFEASGRFYPTNLNNLGGPRDPAGEAQNFTVFEVRPFRWKKITNVFMRREVQRVGSGDERREVDSKIQVGEGREVCGEITRGKELLSITRFSLERVRALNAAQRTFEHYQLHTSTPRVQQAAQVWQRERAVGSPTMTEASRDTAFNDVATAQTTVQANARVLAGVLVKLDRCSRTAPNMSAEDSAWLHTSVSGFDRKVQTKLAQIQPEAEAAQRTRERTIAQLRTRLSGRYAPDEGQTVETQPVEQRSSFQTALAEARPRALRDERTLSRLVRESNSAEDPASVDWPLRAIREVIGEVRADIAEIHQLLVSAG